LAKPFVQRDFEKSNRGGFKRKKVLKNLFFVAMTDFGPDLDTMLTAYPSTDIVDALPAVLNRYRQLYIAESEKYAHMTYFFNGGYDRPIAGEKRILVPSPAVLSYKNTPHMSLSLITRHVVKALKGKRVDFIGVNISNADMLAHTGSIKAAVTAIEYVDASLHKIVDTALSRGGTVCITADHGNAEELINRESGEIDTEHSTSLVPFIIIRKGARLRLRKKGLLADIAPTILNLMGVDKPKLMTGKSLIVQ
jgi:2,3-bisphosphoglycerate-independent phosphoglycerate mutase